MRIKIYQIESEKDTNRVKFNCFDNSNEFGGVNPAIYKCVFNGDVEAENLEGVFYIFNFSHQGTGTMQGHSLSMSDIVEIIPNNSDHEVKARCYFCDAFCWQKIDFDTSKCAKMDGIRVLMLDPGKAPVETKVINELKHWQRAVSDHNEDSLIEITNPFYNNKDRAVIISNEESKLIGMQGNRTINDILFAGPMFIAGENSNGELRGLTDKQVEKYTKMFKEPEVVTKQQVEDSTGIIFIGF